MVYSTCSIDPIENEAVVAELLRKCPWMELVEIDSEILPSLIMHDGLSSWEIIDDDGEVVEIANELPKLPGLKLAHLPPKLRHLLDEDVTSADEDEIAEQLKVNQAIISHG